MAKRSISGGRHSGALVAVTLASALVALGSLARVSETGGWAMFNSLKGAPSSAGRTEPDGGEPGIGPILNLPHVIVKLQVNDRDLYVDVAFDLEVGSEPDKDAVRDRLARIQEATIKVLSESTPDDVRGSRHLSRTKARLLERFRGVVPGRNLKALYVSYLMVG